MADARALTPISEADYEAIEAAVMETDRGRWFLREYARRNRTADTQMLLDAIGRLEQVVAGERVAQDVDRLRLHLKEMAAAISHTKSEIASIHQVEREHSRLFAASEALDSITRQTELATSDILAAAEHIQECAWTLREEGANPELCDELDRRATEIYTACSFQDLTAQRIAKIIQTLRYLEGRINAMIALWDGSEMDLPEDQETLDLETLDLAGAPGAVDLTQSDIDSVIVGEDLFDAGDAAPAENEAPAPALAVVDAQDWDTVATTAARAPDNDEEIAFEDAMSEVAEAMAAPIPAAPEPVPPPLPAPRLRLDAFREVDALSTREKLRLFT